MDGPFNRTEFLYLLRNNLVSIFAPRLNAKREEDVYEVLLIEPELEGDY